jgi:acyl-CoA reductase-like NAD-dependent aldehyde dehydrogenase
MIVTCPWSAPCWCQPSAADRSGWANWRTGSAATTRPVSRQVAKLESLGLIARRAGKTDRRITEAVVTEKGWAISEMLDAARERLAGNALAGWSEHDLADLARLLRRFADNLMHRPEQL